MEKTRIGAIIIVSMVFLSGMMVLPSSVQAKQGQPDLIVRGIGWVYPVETGDSLPVTVTVENIGEASVQHGFWAELHYAELSGFWQEATETYQLWVEPPIRAGEIKAIETTIVALNTHQVNFEAIADTTNLITEVDENNNEFHRCLIAVGATPGTSISVPVFLKNEMLFGDVFTVSVDESTIPEGWGFAGGLPPTIVTAVPGGNVQLSESAIIPLDTTTNPVFYLSATRQSDLASQTIMIKVITTPEIGFSLNPYTNEFSMWGADHTQQSDFVASSTIISENGHKRVEQFTVTDYEGQYVQATLEILSTRQHFEYSILEINYNGVITITPENNRFLTTFLVNNGELNQFFQYSIYSPGNYAFTHYDSINNETEITAIIDSGQPNIGTYYGWEAMGSRIESGKIVATLLDTSDPSEPCCANNLFCYNPAFCGIGL